MSYGVMGPVDPKVEKYLKRQEKLESERGVWETNWQECMDFITPRKANVVSTHTPGSKKGAELFDSTAIYANVILGGALHGMLTNPTIRFFDLSLGDPVLDAITDVRKWLETTADKIYTVLQESNFQTEISEIYTDLGSIGTGALWIGEHKDKVVHFGARAIREIFVAENNLGLIDIVHRKFDWSLRQIVQEFGIAALPLELQQKYMKDPECMYCVLHVVEPSDDDGAISIQRYKSCYLLKHEKAILSEGGFNEFPFAVMRWTKTSGEVYGRGPGMDALPDIKMVNVMMETTLKGAQKTVDPPLLVDDDGVIGRVRLTPGGLTIVRPGSNGPRVTPLLTNSRIDFGYQAVEDVRKRIRASFYVDQLQLREGPQKTATEVNTLMEENLRLMGPVLSRQEFEGLGPIVERVFGAMQRRGLVSDAPEQIRGKKFAPKYSSLVARAQRMSEGQNVARAFQAAAPLFQIDPSVVDRVDSDKGLQRIMGIYGLHPDFQRSDADVAKRKKGREAAQATLAQEAQQQHQAEIASKIAPVLKPGG